MLHCDAPHPPVLGAFTATAHCPHCGDWMVAPINSQFVESGEIRHHWQCESCGKGSTTRILLVDD